MGTLGLAVRHNAAESWGGLRKRSSEAKKMQSSVLVAFLLTFVLAHEEPETKELLVFRRKINLVNNVLHGTVRKILRPYKNKIPRTFTKNTRVHHDDPIPFPSYPTFPQTPGVVPSQTPSGSLSLDETLAADDRFTTLVAALAAAFDNRPTADVLNGTSPLTLFAPTNSAFAKVGNETLDGLLKDPDALSGVLQRHLVANKAVRIPDGTTTLETLDGGSLTIQRTIDDIFSEGVTVRSSQATAKIVQLDIQASDGVIHAIDTVL